jgi:hypothetical protein
MTALPALLETAATRADPETAAILRRAALHIKIAGSIVFDEDIEDALTIAAAGIGTGRDDAIRQIMRDWLVGHGYLAHDEPDAR